VLKFASAEWQQRDPRQHRTTGTHLGALFEGQFVTLRRHDHRGRPPLSADGVAAAGAATDGAAAGCQLELELAASPALLLDIVCPPAAAAAASAVPGGGDGGAGDAQPCLETLLRAQLGPRRLPLGDPRCGPTVRPHSMHTAATLSGTVGGAGPSSATVGY
jgi:hypothetical protein